MALERFGVRRLQGGQTKDVQWTRLPARACKGLADFLIVHQDPSEESLGARPERICILQFLRIQLLLIEDSAVSAPRPRLRL